MSEENLIEVSHVSKRFCRDLKTSLWHGMHDIFSEFIPQNNTANQTLRKKEFWALKDVSFSLKRGESLGLMGNNGAGKTTLLKLINGIMKPDIGEISTRGRVGAMIALGIGFNPILTGRENICLSGSFLGLSYKDIKRSLDGIIAFSELEEFIDTPVQSYSSGMKVRLGFSISSSLHPDVLLLDEVLAVGDIQFRMKCHQRLAELRDQCAMILVTHNPEFYLSMCTQGLLLEHGQSLMHGSIEKVVEYYLAEKAYSTPIPEITEHDNESLGLISSINSDRPTYINAIYFETQEGDKIKTPVSGKDILLNFDLHSSIGIKNLCIKCNFHSKEGDVLYLDNLNDKHFINLKSGKNKVSIQLDALGLIPGIYSMRIGILKGKLNVLDAHEDILFSVIKNTKNPFFYRCKYYQKRNWHYQHNE